MAIKSSSAKLSQLETENTLNPAPIPGKADTDRHLSILIVAKHDRRLASLRAMLRTIPQLEIIEQVDEGPAASSIIANHSPDLVLLAANLPDGQAWTILKQINDNCPRTRCLVLIDTIEQRRLAEATGADEIVTSEFPVAQFRATIEQLLAL